MSTLKKLKDFNKHMEGLDDQGNPVQKRLLVEQIALERQNLKRFTQKTK